MKIDTKQFKEKLEQELQKLTEELQHVGKLDPKNASDWVPSSDDLNVLTSDKNEVADQLEEYGEHRGIVNELEVRYNNVRDALKKIEDGTYGTCKVCGKEIETARLEANPAAETCKEHINS